MVNIKKELIVFLVLFIIASLTVHMSEWFSIPLDHMSALSSHPMPYHPILYVLIIYILVSLLRGVFTLLSKLLKR